MRWHWGPTNQARSASPVGTGQGIVALAALGLALASAPAARADLIFSVNNVVAAAGSSGSTTLEVSLTNTGAPVLNELIAAIQFRLTVPGASGVTFRPRTSRQPTTPTSLGSTPPHRHSRSTFFRTRISPPRLCSRSP